MGKLCNPYSINNFFAKDAIFDDYWVESGGSSIIVSLLREEERRESQAKVTSTAVAATLETGKDPSIVYRDISRLFYPRYS